MGAVKKSTAESFLVTATERSTARTETPASNPLTREEVAAIWLFPEDYAAQGEHARIWYRGLSDHARRSVGQFLWALDEAAR